MKRSDFLRAMPPMPDSFVQRMTYTLERKEQYIMKRQKATRLIIAVAILGALLVAGCAVALTQSGLLSKLFYQQQPPQEAVELVETVNESATDARVSVSVDEYAYDGNELAVSYTLTNEGDETLIVYNENSRDFGIVYDEAGNILSSLRGWGDSGEACALGGEVDGVKLEKTLNCGKQIVVPTQSRSQKLTLTVTAGVYRPIAKLASSDETAGEGDVLVMAGDSYSWESARNTALLESWHKQGHEYDDLDMAVIGLGIIEKVGEVSVTKTLEPRKAAPYGITMNEPIQIDVGDCCVTLSNLRFTALATNYDLAVRRKDGGIISNDDIWNDYAISKWWGSCILDGEGNPIKHSGGGTLTIAPDGKSAYLASFYADPLAKMPSSIVLCPEKENFVEREGEHTGRYDIERFDLSQAVRLDVEDGVVAAPAQPQLRRVTYAPDFYADAPSEVRMLTAKPVQWTGEILSQALAGGKKLSFDGYDTYGLKDGTHIVVDSVNGHLFYQKGGLDGEYGSVLMILRNKRLNLKGEIKGFSSAQALAALDNTLDKLGLKRGRTVYLSALTKKDLMQKWIDYQVEGKNRGNKKMTPEQEKKYRKRLQSQVTDMKAPKGGYYITFSLSYDGLNCVPEDRPINASAEKLMRGSGMTAFVNPDGVIHLNTLDCAAIYQASPSGEAAFEPIPLDRAKVTAEGCLSRGEAGQRVEIQSALYEYLPVWEGEDETRLTLVPVWSFCAARTDGALYPLVYVDAKSGELRF